MFLILYYLILLNFSGTYNNNIGYSNFGVGTTGSYNNVLGSNSMSSLTSGLNNIAIGDQSLQTNATGSYNYSFGTLTRTATAALNHTINIGYGSIVYKSNEVLLGDTGHAALNTFETVIGIGTTNIWNATPSGTGAYVVTPSGMSGWGRMQISDPTGTIKKYATFRFEPSGVNLEYNNVVSTVGNWTGRTFPNDTSFVYMVGSGGLAIVCGSNYGSMAKLKLWLFY